MGLQGADLGACVIGEADFADLAFRAQGGERFGHLGRMAQHVWPVDLVEVDHVDLQAAEGRFARLAQIGFAAVIGGAGDDAAFAGDHHAVAQGGACGQHLAEQLLGGAEMHVGIKAVDVRRVEQGHARIQRNLDLARGIGHIGARIAPHAIGDGGDREAALAEAPV